MASTRIRQHVSGFIDSEPQKDAVSSLSELLALPFVVRWQETYGMTERIPFKGWGRDSDMLIAVYDIGWYVVAYVDPPDILDELPTFSVG